MATTHPTDIRNGIADYINTQIGSGGYIELTTLGGVTIAIINLNTPAFNIPVLGTMSIYNPPLTGIAIASGKASLAYIKDSGGSIIFQGVVSAIAEGTGDLQLEIEYLNEGDTVNVTQLDYVSCL